MPKHSHTRGTMNITGTYRTGSGNNAGLGDDYSMTQATGALGKNSIGNGKTTMSTSGSYDRCEMTLDASKSWTGETSEVGLGQAHNIVQPYLAVYLFKRNA